MTMRRSIACLKSILPPRDNREYYAGTVIVTPVIGAAIIELSDDEYKITHWYSYLAHIALISELNIKIVIAI